MLGALSYYANVIAGCACHFSFFSFFFVYPSPGASKRASASIIDRSAKDSRTIVK